MSGAVWGVNSADHIFKLNNNGKSWTHVTGGLMHVSSGPGGVWGVNKGHHIYYREGTQLIYQQHL